jgi:cyclin A
MVSEYMPLQPHLDVRKRRILVDWLIQIADVYRSDTDSLFTAVNLLDRFLGEMVVPVENFQLVGAVCFGIAEKCVEKRASKNKNERQNITAKELCAFNPDAISLYAKHEAQVLNTLRFELHPPHARLWLRIFNVAAAMSISLDHSAACLACYVCDLSLLDYNMAKWSPSKVAASCVLIGIYVTERRVEWSPVLKHFTGCTMDDILPCVQELWEVYKTGSELNTLRNKYSSDIWKNVAKIPIPEISPIDWLKYGSAIVPYQSLPHWESTHYQRQFEKSELMVFALNPPCWCGGHYPPLIYG